MQPGTTPTVRAEMTSATTDSTVTHDFNVTPDSASADLIQTVLAEMQERLGSKRFALWCEGKIRLSIADDRLTVAVGSPFLLNWMQKQFRDEMTRAAQTVLGPSAQVAFTVDATLSVSRPRSHVSLAVNIRASRRRRRRERRLQPDIRA